MDNTQFGGGFEAERADANIRGGQSTTVDDSLGQGTQRAGRESADSPAARLNPRGGEQRAPGGSGAFEGGAGVDDESVSGEGVRSGSANLSGGVVRRKRRAVGAKGGARYGVPVTKNYRTTDAVMFNNLSEMFLDSISPEYAQEILEELFGLWGIPLEQPESAKYAEDLVTSFLISVTASNKADYYKEFEVPVRGDAVIVNFIVLSELLNSGHNITRRRFARGLADRMRDFIRKSDNMFMLPLLASRVGCDPQYAFLAFDGSTHCSNLTSRELQFVRTLESRNLFEDDSVLAAGASDRLMQGTHGGPRSVVAR